MGSHPNVAAQISHPYANYGHPNASVQQPLPWVQDATAGFTPAGSFPAPHLHAVNQAQSVQLHYSAQPHFSSVPGPTQHQAAFFGQPVSAHSRPGSQHQQFFPQGSPQPRSPTYRFTIYLSSDVHSTASPKLSSPSTHRLRFYLVSSKVRSPSCL